MRRIYLDTAAATPVDRRVARAMWRAGALVGNPASLHEEGVVAARALASARATVAACLDAQPEEIIFTSGGTESNNLALRGVGGDGPIITTTIEHASVKLSAQELAARGTEVVCLGVDQNGLIDLAELARALRPSTKLISLIYAHHEFGVIQPVREVMKLVRDHRAKHGVMTPYVHLDASQAARHLDLSVARLGVDLMTLGAGKFYGPRGIGLLYVRRGVPVVAEQLGGGQELGRRSGTEPVALAVGLARALELARASRAGEAARLEKLGPIFAREVTSLPGVELVAATAPRVPHILNFLVEGVLAEQLVLELDARGVAASTGSACAIRTAEESYAIMALGRSSEVAKTAIRFSLDRTTTARQLRAVSRQLAAVIGRLRKYQPQAYARDSFPAL